MKFENKGFTLIEFLGVIAIISLLFALIFPAISASRQGALRHRSRWQFLELKSALESYRTHYGDYPPFLRPDGTPTALNGVGRELVDALQGRDGTVAPATNPDNLRFLEFSSRFFNGKKQLADAFGNENLYIIIRRPDSLAIPIHAFPSRFRSGIPEGGLVDSIAIYSLGSGSGRDVASWE